MNISWLLLKCDVFAFISEAMRAPYHTNYSPMRLFIHNLVMSAYFDLAIAVVIIINVITMSIEHYNMPLVSTNSAYVHSAWTPVVTYYTSCKILNVLYFFSRSQNSCQNREFLVIFAKIWDFSGFSTLRISQVSWQDLPRYFVKKNLQEFKNF